MLKSSIDFGGNYDGKGLLKYDGDEQTESNLGGKPEIMNKTGINFAADTEEISKSNDDFDSSLNRNPLS